MSETDEETKRRIVAYYDATTESSYLANWAGDSLGFHFGIADENTASLAESLTNSNAYLAERAGIVEGTRVLDAGCGVGGSSLFLARERRARVTGITLVERQVELARKFAREQGLEELVTFERADMLATGFAEASFDVVWNLESMCHVADLDGYLDHVASLLVDGGRFACVDLCAGAIPDANLDRVMQEGWIFAGLRSASDIVRALSRHPFELVDTVDLTPRIMRSALALRAMASRSLFKILADREFFGTEVGPIYEGHVRAAIAFAEGLEKGTASVSCVIADRLSRD